MTRSVIQLGGQELKLDADGDTSIQVSTDDVLVIDTAGSERLIVDASGNILVGKTSSDGSAAGHEMRPSSFAIHTRDNGAPLGVRRIGTGTNDEGNYIFFENASADVGQIGYVSTGFFIQGESSHSGFRFGGNQILPFRDGSDTDNTTDLGASGTRFDDIFATNTSISSSDQNEKQDIASATTKELNVAKKLSALFKTFRWKDKVTEKGDKARTHTGIVAQEVQTAFKEEGLDASNYGLFTSDTWTNKDGKEQTRLGVRYPELFSFIFSSIEARLTALESK